MVRDTRRRATLAEAATDYVLEHGLIGLSLRPLGTAIGTSDRMLLYHFADKDDLVATVLGVANDRAVAEVRALPTPPDVRTAVHRLWDAFSRGRLQRCQHVYVQAAALGLLGQQPYRRVVQEANERWVAAVVDYLRQAGCSAAQARRAVVLLDAAFMGFELDLPLDHDSPEISVAVSDLADALARIADGSQPS
jgi:AcrR family transcriptional regulator